MEVSKKKKITQEKSTHKEDINMEILNKNYLQEPKNLNRSVHGARGQKLKFRMTNASTLKKSGYQREANYIEMKPTIWAGFIAKTSPVHNLPRSQGVQAISH